MPTAPRIVALLLSGGAGTRLWPVSRQDCPKQFLKLFGELSLYQLTLKRMKAAGVTDVVVAANRDHRALLLEQAKEIGETSPTLLLEPARRDSGPAIAAGVAYAYKHFGEDAVVCAMACDHLIPRVDQFTSALQSAITLSRAGYLVTFGIAPNSPSTEFGYLQQGAGVKGMKNAFRVDKFHEKPKLELAIQYLASGEFCWNSGMFVFRADVFAAEARQHMPDVWTAVEEAVAKSTKRGSPKSGLTVALAEAPFLSSPRISIDYALFERSNAVAMIRASFAWSDVGNWSAVFDTLAKDKNGNVSMGNTALKDCSNTLVIGEGIRAIAVGVTDLVIVARPEGVFIAPRKRSAEIKDLI